MNSEKFSSSKQEAVIVPETLDIEQVWMHGLKYVVVADETSKKIWFNTDSAFVPSHKQMYEDHIYNEGEKWQLIAAGAVSFQDPYDSESKESPGECNLSDVRFSRPYSSSLKFGTPESEVDFIKKTALETLKSLL